jgi:RHS repeat-associated protein
VVIDTAGNLWVADTGNERVQEAAWPMVTTTYAYDQAGSLTFVQRPQTSTSSPLNQTLAYDATGLLASKTSGLLTRYMAWDATTTLPLLLNDGENSYIYGPGGLPIEQISASGSATYIHHDQLGSIRLLTDASGKASASFSYKPYGGLEGKTGTATTPLTFAGQYTDAETGLQYLRARFYDPATGQFLTRDPIEPLTREPYAYAYDNPLWYVDPSGLTAIAAAPACAAGPVAATACAGAAATAGAACGLNAACRDVVADAAEDFIHGIFGDDSSDDAAEEAAPYDPSEAEEECPAGDDWDKGGKVIGDARQSMDKAGQFMDKLGHSAGSNPDDPNDPVARALAALAKLLDRFQ